jgi:hypothetical protein
MKTTIEFQHSPAAPRHEAETASCGLTPDQVFLKSDLFKAPPLDSAQASIYNDSFYRYKETIAELYSESFRNGDYIRNPDALVRKINHAFPQFAFTLDEPLFPFIGHYMSKLLASIDGPENVIWNADGFATGYRLPASNESLFGDDSYPWVLSHFCFLTIPDAWAKNDNDKVGVSLARYHRILSHRFLGFITPNEDGDGWKPGSANRRKVADGSIQGSVDWVITHPKSGVLYLSPYAVCLMEDNILQCAELIF